MKAKPGKEAEVEAFLKEALPFPSYLTCPSWSPCQPAV